MESLQAAFQKTMASPAVKKLRALEQRRMARIATTQKARSDRFTKTIQHLDAAAKAELANAATRRADELEAQARDIQDLAEALQPHESESDE